MITERTGGKKKGKEDTANNADTSTSSGIESDDDRKLLLKSDRSTHQALREERDLLENLQRKDVKEEEKAVQQSIGSSTTSLSAHNALRIIRESLKSQNTPT